MVAQPIRFWKVFARPLGILSSSSCGVRSKCSAKSARMDLMDRSVPLSSTMRTGRMSDWKSGTATP